MSSSISQLICIRSISAKLNLKSPFIIIDLHYVFAPVINPALKNYTNAQNHALIASNIYGHSHYDYYVATGKVARDPIRGH